MFVFLNNPLFLAFLGLIVGSFVAALTWRLPRGESILKGRSRCPHCRKTIAWYDNLPLISFLLLNGKCRSCHRKISLRYPAIELTTALLFILVGHFFQGNFFYLLVAALLIAILVIDLEHQIIPDQLVFLGIAVRLGELVVRDDPLFFSYLLSALIAALSLLAIHSLTRGKGMGLGDVKLALLLGLFFKPLGVVTLLWSAFLTGGVAAAILILLGRARLKQKIAFGPFLIIGFFISLIWLKTGKGLL
jgi:leader peptidase (prepilin peptidase)/N-methyltransferase